MRVWNVIAWAGRAAPSSRTSGKRNKQGTPKTGLQDKKSAHGCETLAQNQNPTPPGSHRARPVRTEGGAPTTKPIPTPTRRSTRPGCECMPTPFAPRAVLLQQNQSQLRPVGAPAPGANTCPPHSHRGGAPTTKPIPTPTRRSTRPGCEYVPAGSHRGGAPTGSVLYNQTASQCG